MTKGRARRLSKHAGHNVSALYGQEKDAATSGLARMNMILHDNPTALIVQGSSNSHRPATPGLSPHTYNSGGLME
jgi:type I restriction enzyme M protein